MLSNSNPTHELSNPNRQIRTMWKRTDVGGCSLSENGENKWWKESAEINYRFPPPTSLSGHGHCSEERRNYSSFFSQGPSSSVLCSLCFCICAFAVLITHFLCVSSCRWTSGDQGRRRSCSGEKLGSQVPKRVPVTIKWVRPSCALFLLVLFSFGSIWFWLEMGLVCFRFWLMFSGLWIFFHVIVKKCFFLCHVGFYNWSPEEPFRDVFVIFNPNKMWDCFKMATLTCRQIGCINTSEAFCFLLIIKIGIGNGTCS